MKDRTRSRGHLQITAAVVSLLCLLGLILLMRGPRTETLGEVRVVDPEAMGAVRTPLSANAVNLGHAPTREVVIGNTAAGHNRPAHANPPAPVAETNIVVKDAEGRHVSGVAVHLRANADAGTVTSDANGTLRWPVSNGHGQLVAADDRWATVFSAATRTNPGEVSALVIAPTVRVVGRVEDWLGRPVQSAVQIRLPEDLLARFGGSLEHSRRIHYAAETLQDGSFALPPCPAVGGTMIEARVNGRVRASVPIPMSSGVETILTLPRPDSEEEFHLLLGILQDPDGRPIEAARVHWDRCVTATTDSDGRFALYPTSPCRSSTLVAVKSGWGPAVHAFELDENGDPVVPAPLVVVLQPPQTLDGVVVDEDERPVGQCRVWVKNPVYAGYLGDGAVLAETLAAGNTPRLWDYTVTDVEGRFSLVGVVGHLYQIAALDQKTLAQGKALGSVADASNRVVLSTKDARPLTVTVVDRSGTPVIGAKVSVLLETMRIRTNGPRELSRHVHSVFPLGSRTTDGHGMAEFERLSGNQAMLSMEGTDIEPLQVEVTPDHFAEGRITAEITRTAEVCVTVLRPQVGDQLVFLAPDGRECMMLLTRGGGGVTRTNRAPLTGDDLILRVNVDARFAILLRNGKKIRTPIQLVPHAPNRITL